MQYILFKISFYFHIEAFENPAHDIHISKIRNIIDGYKRQASPYAWRVESLSAITILLPVPLLPALPVRHSEPCRAIPPDLP